ncbi:MAG: chemotaxis protein [Firmicutes bacterium]|nr:chemotaxis protein [Bacillota bacterium]
MQLKLRTKLLVVFFLLISIPCSVIGYLSYMQASKALRASIEDSLQSSVMSTADYFVATVQNAAGMLNNAAGDNGIIAAAVTGDANIAMSSLNNLKKNNEALIEDIMVVRTDGQVVTSVSGVKANLKDRDYFLQAMDGRTVTSNVISSKRTNQPVITISQPIRRDGKVVGVLVAALDFSKLAEKVSTLKAGQTGYAFMIDNSGMTVYHQDKSKVLKENLFENPNEQLHILVQTMITNKNGKTIYSLNGQEKLVAYASAGEFIIALNVPVAECLSPVKAILQTSVVTLLVAIIIAMLLAYFVANSIVKPILRLRMLMMAAGKGDLTVISNYQSKDEVGDLSQSFDTMIASQKNIITEVLSTSDGLAKAAEEMAASTEEVTSASEEIAQSMHSLAKEAETGYSSMIETSGILGELIKTIEEGRSKAERAINGSQTAFAAAEKGGLKVQEAVGKMNDIKTRNEATGQIVADLNEYSRQIRTIIDTITAIAAQTNLLALNAAIEAARAGEHGRGFAVVAEEVRQLAEQSDQGAQEIMALINKVTDKTSHAVEAMANSTLEVENGVSIVSETGESLGNIVAAVKIIVGEIEEIGQAIDREVANSNKVNEHVSRLSAVIETVAAQAEEVAAGSEQQTAAMQTMTASSEETSASATILKEMVEAFKV